MDKNEARSFLSVHRPGENSSDERMAEAEKLAASDPELARWWKEDQELDRAIAGALAAAPVPSDLRARLISPSVARPLRRTSWRRPALLAAAAIITLAAIFGFWRGPFGSNASLASYREEMVRFISPRPTLGLETADLTRINEFLAKSGAPSQFEIPQPLLNLEPVGCQKFRFRGHDVALVCFRREGGKILHLFVINRTALRGFSVEPQYASTGGWMTATWANGDYGYLLTVQGDQSTTEKYIRNI